MAQDFAKAAALTEEYEQLETALSDPATHADQATARRIGKRHAELRPVVAKYREWRQLGDDEAAAREMGAEDPSFLAEAADLAKAREAAAEKLQEMLIPRDPLDGNDVILEIKAGAGGEESALFAGDLMRMYLRYAEKRGWVTQVLEAEESDMGGFKDVAISVKSRGVVAPEEAPYANLKYEGGVHRVQRVPVTESQGRIHTSAAGVLVLPEAEEVDVTIDPNDLRIDVYRSSGPGGQSVNTTDSAVRITHMPTGVVVSCQNEKSQLQNKESAMRILRARLLALAEEEAAAAASDVRKSQVRTVDRSERIRTYNFPENRIADHRVGYKANNLDAVLNGDLGDVIDACIEADTQAKLKDLGSQ
jgi:peptide chain release factor 1